MRDTSEDRAPAWAETVALWGGRVLQFYAAWLLLGMLFRPIGRMERELALLLSVTNVPVIPGLFSAVLVGLVASGFLRRRRIALWFVIVFWQLPSAGIMALAVLLDALDPSAGVLDGVHWSTWVGAGVGLVLTVLLIAARSAFPARIAPGAWWRAAGVVLTGILTATGVVWALLQVVPNTLPGQWQRVLDGLSVSLGLNPHEEPFALSGAAPVGLAWIAGGISGLGLVAAVVVYLHAGPGESARTPEDELAVRRLLLEFPGDDSLAYFATRDDRSTVFSADGRAAVSYRVVSGVLLAAGDPLGDPASWPDAIDRVLARARQHGWAPGVLSASERGARAYRDAGLSVLTMGDEAILSTRDFELSAPSMRAVRHAVARPQREGYTVRLRRQAEIPAEELSALVEAANQWRHGDDERGFSMASERLGSPRDPRVLVVTAHAADGTLRGLLSFVPWGRTGVSLDYMRRSPEAVPGVTELMITALATQGPGIAVDRVSLNFAMFRGIIEQGESVAAGPLQRLGRRVILFASRWWQLDQLYRSNQKYAPRWRPRYLCYGASSQLTAVTLAAGQAEGFVPAWTVRRVPARPTPEQERELGEAVREQEARLLALAVPTPRLTDQERARRHTLQVLTAAGMPAYPVAVPRTHALGEVGPELLGSSVSISGRVVRLRDFGGVCFAVLRAENTERQVMLTADGAADIDLWRRAVDLADHVSVTGIVTRSRTGELTVHATSWVMAAKALTPPPDKVRGLVDPETRLRLRHVDLALDTTASRTLRGRSRAVHALRSTLVERGFAEVETPILQRVHGGANARPFTTHINAYDMDLYLRIAPELFLKQLAIGGMERVFELGRNFRNEGADATHNPEFTSLEAYQAFGDYTTMRHLTRELIVAAAIAVHGEPISRRADGSVVRLDGDWPVVTVHEAVSRAVGTPITPDTPLAELHRVCAAHQIAFGPEESHGALVTELYDRLVEGRTVEPTFYTDFPVETSPLTRVHRDDPRLAERWDLVAFGAELGTAYSELIDPVDQRERLTQQSLLAAAGDPEAMEVDEGFLSALEFGMPPTGGLGLGVDRVYMMLIGASIRETLAFPFVKPHRRG